MLLPLVFLQASVQSFNVEGVRREALVYRGIGTAPATGRPVVFAFHGHGGGMRQVAFSLGVHELWPEAMVIYPQGLPTKGMTDPQGQKAGWQQNAGEEGDRDLKFVDTILASLRGVDRRRTFTMGHSNGGRFTYVLWSARSDRFAAYGPSSSPAVLLARRFLPPAPVFVTAGESDPIVPYAGQKATIDALVRLDGVDLSKATTTGYVTLATGKTGIPFGAYIHPGGHEYPPAAVEATIALFKRL